MGAPGCLLGCDQVMINMRSDSASSPRATTLKGVGDGVNLGRFPALV